MKTMTCMDMGGECDMEFKAETSADMAKQMTAHVIEMHPETAEKMKNMTPEEHEKWEAEFHKNWDSAQEAE